MIPDPIGKIVSLDEVAGHKPSKYKAIVRQALELAPDQALEFDLQALGTTPKRFASGVQVAAFDIGHKGELETRSKGTTVWVWKKKSEASGQESGVSSQETEGKNRAS